MILSSHGIIGSQITQFVGLLDAYPNAAAAYSLRKLRTAYTGSAIRVRRASDSTELDIGFSGNELDTSALTTFCSGTNGFVKTWYDQSGNARNATQTTAENQPQIVSSGSVIFEGSKPTLQFDGINDRLGFAKINLSAATSLVTLKRNATTSIQNVLDVQDTLQNYANINVSMNSLSGYGNLLVFSQNTSIGAVNGLGGPSISIYRLYTAIWTGLGISGASFYKIYDNNTLQSLSNSSAVGPASGPTSLLGSAFSSGVPSFFFDGKIQEVILYGTDQNANIVALNTNINNFYSIY